MHTISAKEVQARKNHKCDWCSEIIYKDEPYIIAACTHDGRIYNWKSHIHCDEIFYTLNMNDCDEGDGIDSETFKELVREAFNDLWFKKDLAHYESEAFVIPSITEQIEFIIVNSQ